MCKFENIHLLKTVQTITTFRNPLADPMGTRRGLPLVRGPQFENRWNRKSYALYRMVAVPMTLSAPYSTQNLHRPILHFALPFIAS